MRGISSIGWVGIESGINEAVFSFIEVFDIASTGVDKEGEDVGIVDPSPPTARALLLILAKQRFPPQFRIDTEAPIIKATAMMKGICSMFLLFEICFKLI